MTRLLSLAGLATLSVASACAAPEWDGDDVRIADTEDAIRAYNGLPANGLPMNGLPMNGLPANGLPMNGLPMNGLPMNGLPMNGLSARSDFNSWFHWFSGCT